MPHLIRFLAEAKAPLRNITDAVTGQRIFWWRGSDITLELALTQNGQHLLAADIGTLIVEVKTLLASPSDAALMRKEYGSADCDATFTAASWANGSKALLTADFTDVEAALPPGHYRIIIRHEDPAGLKNTFASSEIEVIEDHSESSSLSAPPSPGSEYWNKTEADTRYQKTADLTGKIYFDDFEALNTTDNNIGLAKSGQPYTLIGSGIANLRRQTGTLRSVSPRGTAYLYPSINFIPAVFGTRFSMLENPGGSTSVVFAMLVARTTGGLDPMIHLTWNDSILALEKWPGPGSSGKSTIASYTYPTKLRRDGTPYTIEMRFYPETDTIIINPPDGSSPIIVTFSDLSTYLTQHIAFEYIDTDTSVFLARFEAAWAWPQNESRPDWSAHARAESARGPAASPLIDRDTNKIAASLLPGPAIQTLATASATNILATTDVALNTFDMTGTTFKLITLPPAAAAGPGKTIRLVDVTGTLFPGSQFILVNVNAADTFIGASESSTAHRFQGRETLLVSDGVSKWTVITNSPAFLTATATIDLPSIAANSEHTATITVPGARTSGSPAVSLGFASALPDGVVVKQAWVSASDTVSIRVRNTTGSSIDPASQVIRATVFKH